MSHPPARRQQTAERRRASRPFELLLSRRSRVASPAVGGPATLTEPAKKPLLAPTQDLLTAYKNEKTMSWPDYKRRFKALLAERASESRLSRTLLDRACLLCSEHGVEHCHRRLVAERLQAELGAVRVQHL